MKLWRYTILFYLGGLAYCTLELLWRGWTHGSMFLTGGACFLLIGHLGELERPSPLLCRMILGAGIILMAELAAGLLVNRTYDVWDYRNMPGNFMGQICLPFALLWMALTPVAVFAYDWTKRLLFGDMMPKYRWI